MASSSSSEKPTSMYNLLFKSNKIHKDKKIFDGDNYSQLNNSIVKKKYIFQGDRQLLCNKSVDFFIKYILKNNNFDILMLLFSNIRNIDDEIDIEWIKSHLFGVFDIFNRLFKNEENISNQVIKNIKSSFITSNMIYSPKISNIINFLEIIQNFFIEFTLLYDNYSIVNTSELSSDDIIRSTLTLKYSALIYKTRYSIFLKKFKSCIETEFLYRHFGSKERFPLRCDIILSTFYELFFIYFCGNNMQRFNDFLSSSESFNFRVNEHHLSTSRPNYSNYHASDTSHITETYLNRKQELYDIFMKDLINLLSIASNTYVNNDFGYNLHDYGMNSHPDLNRNDQSSDVLLDESIFDLIKPVDQLYLKEVFPKSRIWYNHDDEFSNIKSLKHNFI